MTFQILSLSGGGYLGLYTAAVLAEVEEQTGRRMVDMFDLFAGTSIGGIIALGLSRGVPAAEIRDAFLASGHSIFGSSRPPRGLRKFIDLVRAVGRPRYSSNALRMTIEKIVGQDTTLSELLRPTIVTSVNLTKGGPTVFKTGHHPTLIHDWRLKAVDVALATSAAPTFFPIHEIGSQLFADGGLFGNSPDMIAVHEAERFLDVEASDLRILSVGTTTTCFAFHGSRNKEMGIGSWLMGERLTNVIIGSQQALTHDMMKHRFGPRYVRIDRQQADEQQRDLALDCASEQAKKTLLAMAHSSVAESVKNDDFRAMLNHVAVGRPFLNSSL